MLWSRHDQLEMEKDDSHEARALSLSGLLGWAALGAGMMYVLDPNRGRRRRAIARDKALSAGRRAVGALERAMEDLGHRVYGAAISAVHRATQEAPGNEVLRERVRARLGRVVSHPHAIRVSCDDGTVTLTGQVLSREVDDLIDAVGRVPGVGYIDPQLEIHDHAGHIPSLQGQATPPGDRWDLTQENWGPGTRLLAGSVGAAMALSGAARGGLGGLLLTALGGTLALRSASNLDTRRLTGMGAGRRAIDLRKTININASPEDVFVFWSNYDNFPLFMSNVREVRSHENGLSHWVVAGPAGTSVEWDAIETERIENQLIAWKSVAGAAVASAGCVRFDRNDDGSTRVQVEMSYNPPGGAIGHAFARIFGADPKHQMDQDLMRMKTLIETGNFPRDAAQRPVSLPG